MSKYLVAQASDDERVVFVWKLIPCVVKVKERWTFANVDRTRQVIRQEMNLIIKRNWDKYFTFINVQRV